MAYRLTVTPRTSANTIKKVRSITQQLACVLFDPAIIITLLTDYLWNVLANPNTDRLDASANYMNEIRC